MDEGWFRSIQFEVPLPDITIPRLGTLEDMIAKSLGVAEKPLPH
jgi:hypothetical protein